MRYEVIVGNVGTIYGGEEFAHASAVYRQGVQASKANYGRMAGEPVYLMQDGEPVDEYEGTNHEEE